MPSLAQVLWRPRKASRQSRPASLRVPPLILRLVTWQRMSFSEPLVLSGISGRSSTLSNSLLLARRRASKRSRVAKPVLQPKMRSNRADKVALRVGERIEFVNQTFGVDPAQAVRANIELAGVVADDHGVGQQTMRLDAAPQSPFSGDQHGIGMDLQGGHAEPLQMSVPRRAIGEDALVVLAQAGDDGSGERAGAHIGEGFVIDDVIAVPGAQQFEEVETAL